MIYLVFNCSYNIFIVMVIKYGGAALMYVVMTLRLPMLQVAFALTFINDPPDPFYWTSLIGLAFILFGLVAYRYNAVAQPDGEAEDVMIGAIGQNPLSFPSITRRPRQPVRNALAIRTSLLGKLGFLGYPVTPRTPHRTRSPVNGIQSPPKRGVGSSRTPPARYINILQPPSLQQQQQQGGGSSATSSSSMAAGGNGRRSSSSTSYQGSV
jgi:hypothetical protein